MKTIKRIRVFYKNEVKEGNIIYTLHGNGTNDYLRYGVIFDNGSTDTISEYDYYKIL